MSVFSRLRLRPPISELDRIRPVTGRPIWRFRLPRIGSGLELLGLVRGPRRELPHSLWARGPLRAVRHPIRYPGQCASRVLRLVRLLGEALPTLVGSLIGPGRSRWRYASATDPGACAHVFECIHYEQRVALPRVLQPRSNSVTLVPSRTEITVTDTIVSVVLTSGLRVSGPTCIWKVDEPWI